MRNRLGIGWKSNLQGRKVREMTFKHINRNQFPSFLLILSPLKRSVSGDVLEIGEDGGKCNFILTRLLTSNVCVSKSFSVAATLRKWHSDGNGIIIFVRARSSAVVVVVVVMKIIQFAYHRCRHSPFPSLSLQKKMSITFFSLSSSSS
jgi:hypothetical protein